MKVVVFYAKEHSGHHKAAEAIAEGFRRWVPDASVAVQNCAEFFDVRMGDFIEKAYMFTIRRMPWLWSWMYDNDGLKKRLKHIKRMNLFLNKHRLLRFIRDASPEVILCTQAVPCEMICILKFRGLLHVPLIAVPTDFYVHSYWIHPEVDAYFVACERSKRELSQRGIEPEKIAVTGIPVHPDFAQRGQRSEARKELGLDEYAKTVLMMGGGLGLVSYDKLIKSILSANNGLQVISVLGCAGGKLERIRSRIKSDRVGILGYVDNVPDLMEASDAIVSKPGGLTCAEVLAKGLPFVMTSPLPGQEEQNVHYMLSSGAAVYASSPHKVADWIHSVLGTEGASQHLSSKALAFGRPNAVRDIVAMAVERVERFASK